MLIDPVIDERNIPLCAGVLILEGERVLLALSTTECWIGDDRKTWIPVTGIGGGQEPGETMLSCARREAREEIGCEVELVHSPLTYVETDGEAISAQSFEERPAPLFYQVQKRLSSEPYASGLPSGDRLHIGIFRALARRQPIPCDVPALLWAPLDSLTLLAPGLSVEVLERAGISLICPARLPESALLFIPKPSTEDMLRRVVEGFGPRAVSAIEGVG